MSIQAVLATDGAEGCPEPAEIVTIEDLLTAIGGVCDRHDLAIVGPITHRGLTVLLPDGHVEIQLRYRTHIPLTRRDTAPSDQFPMLSLHAGRADDCGDGPAADDDDAEYIARIIKGFNPSGIDPED